MSKSCDSIGAFLAYGIELPAEIFADLYEGDGTILHSKDDVNLVMKLYGTDDNNKYFCHVGKCFRSGCYDPDFDDEDITLEHIKEIQGEGHKELFRELCEEFDMEVVEPKWKCLFVLGNTM